MLWHEGSVAIYRIRGFFMPLNFHELFWSREIKFGKCCRNAIVILKFLVKNLGKNSWSHEILKANIQFLKKSWKYTSVKITLYTVVLLFHIILHLLIYQLARCFVFSDHHHSTHCFVLYSRFNFVLFTRSYIQCNYNNINVSDWIGQTVLIDKT